MKTEPFVMLPRSLLESAAWRGASVNVYRLLTFLMTEHLARGGKRNGQLKAPHRQLVEAGISSRLVGGAIREAEHRGIVRVHRAGMRAATSFTLTWLPTANGQPATDDWRQFDPAVQLPQSAPPTHEDLDAARPCAA